MSPTPSLTVNEQMEYSLRLAENTKKQIALTTDLSDRIKKNLSTKRISYDDYKEAFDYVARLFPDVDVINTEVHQASPLLLKKLGYDGIGGFFERISKTVVISAHQIVPYSVNNFSVRAKLHRDEVVVHELLHYCHNSLGTSPSVNMKEEFAYGWSYGYLRGKGYSDEEVVRDNYMPYLYNVCYRNGFFNTLKADGVGIEKLRKMSLTARGRVVNRLRNKIHKEILKLATEKGHDIIRIYKKKIEEGLVYHDISKPKHSLFDVIDFD